MHIYVNIHIYICNIYINIHIYTYIYIYIYIIYISNKYIYIFLKEIFEFAPHCRIHTRNKFAKLKIPFRKTNMGQKAISFVGPSLWNSLSEVIKKSDNLNTFKPGLLNF